MTRSIVCIAALLCALAAPAAALAQGAGDEQYEDPFGDEQSQQDPAPTATPAPAQPAPGPAQPAPAPSSELPRTGLGAGWVALAGAILLASGLALRRRADLQR